MPRQKRFLPPDCAFHIMCRGNNGNQIFYSDQDYLKYLELLQKYKNDHPFDLFHYCLMNNHIHMLVRINGGNDFSVFMKKLNISYFRYYQSTYGWRGHFWQDRFKSKYISKDSYLVQCGKYIELNSVRAGIAADPCNYKWSSYGFYALNQPNDLITEDIFYKSIGNNDQDRSKSYQNMVVEDVFSFSAKLIAQGNKKEIYNANRRYQYHIKHKEALYRKS